MLNRQRYTEQQESILKSYISIFNRTVRTYQEVQENMSKVVVNSQDDIPSHVKLLIQQLESDADKMQALNKEARAEGIPVWDVACYFEAIPIMPVEELKRSVIEKLNGEAVFSAIPNPQNPSSMLYCVVSSQQQIEVVKSYLESIGYLSMDINIEGPNPMPRQSILAHFNDASYVSQLQKFLEA